MIAVNQHSEGNRPLFDRDGLVAWTADVPGSPDRYLALFNTRDRFPLDLRTPSFASPLVTRATPGHGVEVDADVRGRARLVLVAEGGEDGSGWDHALWTEPRLVMSDGTERRLTDEPWVQATAGWGEVSTERAPSGGPMRVDGRSVRYGIAAHARSLVEYPLAVIGLSLPSLRRCRRRRVDPANRSYRAFLRPRTAGRGTRGS